MGSTAGSGACRRPPASSRIFPHLPAEDLRLLSLASRLSAAAPQALPPTLHRTHYRQRVSPRFSPSKRTPYLDVQPACEPGSTWNSFTFTELDKGKTLRVDGLDSSDGSLGYRLSVDGEVRTDVWHTGIDANYTMTTVGRCFGLLEPISSLEECSAAALTLESANGQHTHRGLGDTARDDGRGLPPLNRASSGPRGCYLEGKPPIDVGREYRVNSRTLYFNVNDTNTGSCSIYDVCICRRVRLASPSAAAVMPATPPPSPPAAPPPPPGPPGSAYNLTNPTQCAASQCCVVLYKGDRGANCGGVPIWDFTGWVHPGGSFVVPSMLCSSVRFNWLEKNSGHGQCDSNQNCDPEADRWDAPFIGGAGAVRVGTYVDTASAACASAATSALATTREYEVCDVDEGVTGRVRLLTVGQMGSGDRCPSSVKDFMALANPRIELSDSPPLATLAVGASAVSLVPVAAAAAADFYVLGRLDTPCRLSANAAHHSYLLVQDPSAAPPTAAWYRLDKRLRFRENTPSSPCAGVAAASSATAPSYDGAAGVCPAAPRFDELNAAGCAKQPTCAAPAFAPTPFMLNASTLRAYYELSGVLAYRIEGLRFSSDMAETAWPARSPCEAGLSRWWRVAHTACASAPASLGGGADTPLDNFTRASIEAAMVAANDANDFLRDIDVVGTINAQGAGVCTASVDGVDALGARLTIGGSCWRHVQQSEGNVYSFTYWAAYHAGNEEFSYTSNPIERPAKQGRTHISLPASHSMYNRWREVAYKIPDRYLSYIGRYGDVVDFAQLPPQAQPREMAEYLGAAEASVGARDGPAQVCGSPGEASSLPLLGHRYNAFLAPDEKSTIDRLYPHGSKNGKMMVWTTVVLNAADQLRQRVRMPETALAPSAASSACVHAPACMRLRVCAPCSPLAQPRLAPLARPLHSLVWHPRPVRRWPSPFPKSSSLEWRASTRMTPSSCGTTTTTTSCATPSARTAACCGKWPTRPSWRRTSLTTAIAPSPSPARMRTRTSRARSCNSSRSVSALAPTCSPQPLFFTPSFTPSSSAAVGGPLHALPLSALICPDCFCVPLMASDCMHAGGPLHAQERWHVRDGCKRRGGRHLRQRRHHGLRSRVDRLLSVELARQSRI